MRHSQTTDDINQRFAEEWQRADCANHSYGPISKIKFSATKSDTVLGTLARVVPSFDAHYVLSGERLSYRLPEELSRIVSRLSQLNDDQRFDIERSIDAYLRYRD